MAALLDRFQGPLRLESQANGPGESVVCSWVLELRVLTGIFVAFVGVAASESCHMTKLQSVARSVVVCLACFGGLTILGSFYPVSTFAAAPPAEVKKGDKADAHAPAAAPKAAEAHPVVDMPKGEKHGEVSGHDTAHEGGHGKKNPYDPLEWKRDLALWTLVTFGIFVVVLRAFAWGPLTSALDARELKIHGQLAHAEEARVKAEKMLADYQAKLAAAQDQVLVTLAEARRDAEHTRQVILAQTEQEVAALKNRVVAEIEQTRDAALNELFAHMAGTVANATEKVLGRAITDADQDRLVNEALVEFSRQQAS
jgi:F-type H+-transporting ATPase subunit b